MKNRKMDQKKRKENEVQRTRLIECRIVLPLI